MEKIEWAFLTDLHLIKRIKDKNCEKSLIELSERHSGLYFKIIKKYSKSFFANNIDLNEATADKNLIIWIAIYMEPFIITYHLNDPNVGFWVSHFPSWRENC